MQRHLPYLKKGVPAANKRPTRLRSINSLKAEKITPRINQAVKANGQELPSSISRLRKFRRKRKEVEQEERSGPTMPAFHGMHQPYEE